MLDREFFRWLLIVAALLGGAVWLLGVLGTGFSGPGWVPPAAFMCLAVAVAMPRGLLQLRNVNPVTGIP